MGDRFNDLAREPEDVRLTKRQGCAHLEAASAPIKFLKAQIEHSDTNCFNTAEEAA